MAVAGWTIAAVLALLAPQALGVFSTSLLTQIAIFGLFALGVDLLIGHSGLVPMGHAAFFAMGAYTTAILEVWHGASFLPAAAAGVAGAVLLAAFFGVAVRTKGVYFILVTLAMGHVVWGVLMRWTTVSGGENGIGNIPPPAIGPLRIESLSAYYYLALVVVVLCTLAYRLAVHSPFGLALRGIRESESRMRALGYRTRAHKFAAFVLSGLMAGIAGVLYVHWNRFVSPATANFSISAEVVLMVCIGGSRTILGAFIGSAIILAIRSVLSGYTKQWMIVMGTIFIVTVLWAPEGVVGLGRRLRWGRRGVRAVAEPSASSAGR